VTSTTKTPYPRISRRTALGTAGAAGLSLFPAFGAVASTASAPRVDDLALPVTPEENLENLVRMTASLDPEDTPWFYNGSVYAVTDGAAPLELMRVQGMEIYKMVRLRSGGFLMKGATVTFFTDVATGEWLHQMENPFTGKIIEVPALNAVSGDRGYLYQTTGVRPEWVADDIADAPLDLWWTRAGEFVWLHNETVYPPGLPQPRKQRQSQFVRADHFADKDRRRLPAAFTVSFFAPWSEWLGMGDRPGHLLWHASGAKLESVKDLPRTYLKRIEAEYPDHMTVDIDSFADAEV
jgi:hypothetical protein